MIEIRIDYETKREEEIGSPSLPIESSYKHQPQAATLSSELGLI